ncbi:hypothetical protein DL766_006161 [Monosporascus sp. MC13-8B]|uniref:Uncharacterized protein n=1 Tax=Monosporascus cannonballus TaxID=155416 RepID=A0ABY0HDQ4_9PEZI|nr:hypothetical protein DL762_002555 [Monosporascus cannonballus]RYO95200.1 hypothetical protein DL763_003768 [Monosporascus cannonballus]RYP27854.1 hypothetical protein DL766_006161 [Monosporascus sp. MC13-8B]
MPCATKLRRTTTAIAAVIPAPTEARAVRTTGRQHLANTTASARMSVALSPPAPELTLSLPTYTTTTMMMATTTLTTMPTEPLLPPPANTTTTAATTAAATATAAPASSGSDSRSKYMGCPEGSGLTCLEIIAIEGVVLLVVAAAALVMFVVGFCQRRRRDTALRRMMVKGKVKVKGGGIGAGDGGGGAVGEVVLRESGFWGLEGG